MSSLSKFITQTGLCCSNQLETTFHQFCEKPLHIMSNSVNRCVCNWCVSVVGRTVTTTHVNLITVTLVDVLRVSGRAVGRGKRVGIAAPRRVTPQSGDVDRCPSSLTWKSQRIAKWSGEMGEKSGETIISFCKQSSKVTNWSTGGGFPAHVWNKQLNTWYYHWNIHQRQCCYPHWKNQGIWCGLECGYPGCCYRCGIAASWTVLGGIVLKFMCR